MGRQSSFRKSISEANGTKVFKSGKAEVWKWKSGIVEVESGSGKWKWKQKFKRKRENLSESAKSAKIKD